MTTTAILKNLYTFVNILAESTDDRVQIWDKKSLHNAMRWAGYCEQVCSQTTDKAYRSHLDEQVQSLPGLISPPSCLDVSLDRLQDAQGYLLRNLLQNPLLSESLLEDIINNFKEDNSRINALFEECSKMASPRAALQGLDDLLPLLGLPIMPDSKSTCLRIQGQLLLSQFLKHRKLHQKDKMSLKKYIENIVKRLISDANGWDIVLLLLISTSQQDVAESTISEIKEIVLQCMLIHVSCDTSRLMTTDIHLLGRVAAQYFPVFTMYIHQLVDWGKSMAVVYNVSGSRSRPYSWRYTGNKEPAQNSYGCLVERFKILSSTTERTHRAVIDILKSLGKNKQLSVWKDILKFCCS